jgi:hypothetical protein
LFIVDMAALSSSDAELLGAIPAAGWPGMVIAIGEPPNDVGRSLGVDRVLSRGFGNEELRNAVKDVGAERATVPMRRIGR